MNGITFVYVTCRNNPRLEWFVDSLYNQAVHIEYDLKKIQLVIVDYELQYQESRQEYIKNIIKDRFEFVHVAPMPNVYQGLYKLSKINYHACSLPRNTGICYAKYPYIAFIDDLSVMGNGSLHEIVNCANKNIVVAFAYKKVFNLEVEDGKINRTTETASGTDSRWNGGEPFRKIYGSQLYGYSASPLEVLLKVNGYDEICNSMGGEDYQYGIRVEKTGTPIFYDRHVVFYEAEEYADQGNVFIRRDPLLTDDLYDSLMKKYNVQKRWDPSGRKDLSHFILDLLTRDKSWAEGNTYTLSDLRNSILSGGSFNSVFDPDMRTIEGLFVRDI